MSIRPIDMQTLLPRLQMMKFAQELEINKHNNDLTALDKEAKAESEQNTKRVLKSDRKETEKLRNDHSSGQSNVSSQEQEQEQEESEEEKKKDKDIKSMTGKGNKFDMKV